MEEEEEVFLFALGWLVLVAGLMRNVSQEKGASVVNYTSVASQPASQQRPCFRTRAGQTRILSMSDVKASELGSPASGCRLTPFCGQVRVQPQAMQFCDNPDDETFPHDPKRKPQTNLLVC